MTWIDQRPDDAMAGAFEAYAPEPVKTVDPELFREGMSRIGAAVHIVTTAGSAGQAGFTATAVCSVSDAPPTLLVCLHRRSQSGPVLQSNGIFCVNTLPAGAEAIADAFAGRTVEGRAVPRHDRFASGEWVSLATGSPALISAVVGFDCRVIDVKAVASHNVIFGAVIAVHLGPTAPALVYHRREYKRV
jgi:flavin reductase